MLNAIISFLGKPKVPELPTWPIFGKEGNLMSLEPNFRTIDNYKTDICPFWDENFSTSFAYTGEDYMMHESFISKSLNEYPIMAVFFLWRKRRFAAPVLGLVSILTVLFWYKMIKRCCCKTKNKNKNNIKTDSNKPTKNNKKQKTQ